MIRYFYNNKCTQIIYIMSFRFIVCNEKNINTLPPARVPNSLFFILNADSFYRVVVPCCFVVKRIFKIDTMTSERSFPEQKLSATAIALNCLQLSYSFTKIYVIRKRNQPAQERHSRPPRHTALSCGRLWWPTPARRSAGPPPPRNNIRALVYWKKKEKNYALV